MIYILTTLNCYSQNLLNTIPKNSLSKIKFDIKKYIANPNYIKQFNEGSWIQLELKLPTSSKAELLWVQIKGGYFVYGGDILLRRKFILNNITKNLSATNKPNFDPKWANGTVPYIINAPQGTNYDIYINEVKNAIDSINTLTCMNMIPHTNENDYLEIRILEPNTGELAGGESELGRIGGKQVISLFVQKFNISTVLHELYHTFGFIHEQERSDRDNFIKIISQNIENYQEYGHNFEKSSNSVNTTPYDYCSIMHYWPNAFGKKDANGNQATTIECVANGNNVPCNECMYQYNKSLTQYDIIGLCNYYNLKRKISTKINDLPIEKPKLHPMDPVAKPQLKNIKIKTK